MPFAPTSAPALSTTSELDEALVHACVETPNHQRERVIGDLLAKGANPNARRTLWGVPAWAYGACALHPPSLRLLIQAGADIHDPFRVPNPDTEEHACQILHVLANPRTCGMGVGLEMTMACLVEHGANPNARNSLFQVPLQVALQHGWVEGMQALVRVGADPKVQDAEGNTLWHLLAGHPSLALQRQGEVFQQVIKTLLGWNLDPRQPNQRQATPLDVFDQMPRGVLLRTPIRTAIQQVEQRMHTLLRQEREAEEEALRPVMYDSRQGRALTMRCG